MRDAAEAAPEASVQNLCRNLQSPYVLRARPSDTKTCQRVCASGTHLYDFNLSLSTCNVACVADFERTNVDFRGGTKWFRQVDIYLFNQNAV